MTCRKCGSCCRSTAEEKRIVIVYPRDVKQLAEYFQISERDFAEKYCRKDTIPCSGYSIPAYILKNTDQKCEFLSSENLCEIYSARPVQCRLAPYDYFAYEDLWEHMPCLDQKLLHTRNSEKIDEELVRELLEGYHI